MSEQGVGHWLCGHCGKECVVVNGKTACCADRTVWHYSEAQWAARLARDPYRGMTLAQQVAAIMKVKAAAKRSKAKS